MDGSMFVRIEVDKNDDGSVDRWEYFSADGTLEKVGISRADDGIADRTEFYNRGELTRVEHDTDGDGLVDKWETYAGGSLAKVSFDVTKSGKPTVTIDYRQELR